MKYLIIALISSLAMACATQEPLTQSAVTTRSNSTITSREGLPLTASSIERAQTENSLTELEEELESMANELEVTETPEIAEVPSTVSIRFDLDSAEVQQELADNLETTLSQLKGLSKDKTIEVIGYTDTSGSKAYNNKLSLKRASAVKEMLEQQGILANIKITGGGELTSANAADARKAEISIQ